MSKASTTQSNQITALRGRLTTIEKPVGDVTTATLCVRGGVSLVDALESVSSLLSSIGSQLRMDANGPDSDPLRSSATLGTVHLVDVAEATIDAVVSAMLKESRDD